MIINRKKRESPQIEIQKIEIGGCFLYGFPEELYVRTAGTYNEDTYYVICGTRLRDGFENKFTKIVVVQPVRVTVNIEE